MKLLFFLLMFALPFIIKEIIYRQTAYYHNTKHPYFKIVFDKGLYGEYLTYMELRPFEKQGARFVFNCYLPRGNGTTTEVDVMMIWHSGIYVFESKNYGGWIFGRENRKVWTQCLPKGKGKSAMKAKFFNPIMQNKLHISCLKKTLKDGCPEIHSIIVFSNRCTLKDVRTHSGYKDISVIYRNQVKDVVNQINSATPEMTPDALCDEIHDMLLKYSQVSEDIKKAHILTIQKQLNEADTGDAIAVSADRAAASFKKQDIANASADDPRVVSVQKTETPLSNLIKKCPWCGSPLALRTARRGANIGKQFYGCNNYPKCKYTEKLT